MNILINLISMLDKNTYTLRTRLIYSELLTIGDS
jgi:hypothetical protein